MTSRTTWFVVDPKKSRSTAPRPWTPITIRPSTTDVMTEFLDGVRDGAKGEVHDLTTVNFDAMELSKLLVDRNGWAARLAKLVPG